MKIILNCVNLLGDSLYLLRPVQEYIKQNPDDVVAIVADKGLPYELFSFSLGQDGLMITEQESIAKAIHPDATVLHLSAGQAGELSFKSMNKETGDQLHISEAYAAILGTPLGLDIAPPMNWQQVTEVPERTFLAISPFSRSCSRHTNEKPNKTLDDHKWEYIIRYLRRQNMPVKVISGPGDQLKNCSVPINDYFTAKNLYELEYFLKSCALLISVDNGLGHVASVLQTPMISLWPKVSSIKFIYPRFSPLTACMQIGDPNTATPAAMLTGIKHFTKILLGDKHESTTILSEDEHEASEEPA